MFYDSISGITVKGACFTEDSVFNFFEKESERMAIIYGKNGSGKSTLSRAFLNCNINNNEFGLKSRFIDYDGNEVPFSPEHTKRTFVFNEDYINKNVLIQEMGLDAIVMFGEQIEIDNKIKDAEKTLGELGKEYKNQQDEYTKFEDNTLVTSPQYHRNQIKAILQGNNSWAGIDSKLKGNRQNTAVTDALIDEICALIPSKPLDDLKDDYNQMSKIHNQINSGAVKILQKVDKITIKFDEDYILQILAEKIDKPELTDREVQILDAVLDGKQVFYEDVKNHFTDGNNESCPFCLQPVTTKYRNSLIASVKKVLSKAVDEHKLSVISCKLIEVNFDKNIYQALDRLVLERCENLIIKINSNIKLYNEMLEKKSSNVYTPIFQEKLNISKQITELNEALIELESLRINYNKSIEQKSEILNTLIRLNKEIFRYTIDESYNQYTLLKSKKEQAYKVLNTLYGNMEQIKKARDQFLLQKKSIQIAVDYINKGLQYVFFSLKRLEVRAENDVYVLYSNGIPVRPSDISCGERNIIALCYFFTQMMNNLDESERYSTENLLVIDDPVSSFDYENRIGILSYLKSQILRIMLGNKNSKLILFTHDLSTFYDIYKIVEEVKVAGKNKFNKDITYFHIHELKNKSLTNFLYIKRNEYTLLLECIYRYGAEESPDDEIVIGNVMRRALEAFSTFMYKKGIDSISCDSEILECLSSSIYIDYFENLMYRLVLNGESHMEERVKNLHDPHFFNMTTKAEKVKTARDILCFIWLLNKKHLSSHLSEIKNSTQTINSWCEDILAHSIQQCQEVAATD